MKWVERMSIQSQIWGRRGENPVPKVEVEVSQTAVGIALLLDEGARGRLFIGYVLRKR